MEEEINLEDLAMGIFAKKGKGKMVGKEKPSKLSPAVVSTIKSINELITGIEDKSIADYKKYKTCDKKALKKAYDELGDACYTAKGLIRDSATEEEKKSRRSGMISMVSDYDEDDNY